MFAGLCSKRSIRPSTRSLANPTTIDPRPGRSCEAAHTAEVDATSPPGHSIRNRFQWRERLVVVAVVSVVTVSACLALLGWDHTSVGADGYLSGPYEPWQVITLVVILGVLAVWTGWRGRSGVGTVVATIALTVPWSVDAAHTAQNDGLWGVGAVMVATGTAAAFLLVSGAATRFRSTRYARQERSRSAP
jgi:hypothetical protein